MAQQFRNIKGTTVSPLEVETDDSPYSSTIATALRPSKTTNNTEIDTTWSPSGKWYKDFLHFSGPGWLVSIAYVDPGNYQANIQAGALSQYSLLSIIWWTSVLSLYVQILCVRLAHYGGLSLSEAQAKYSPSARMRVLNWFIAEFSTMITDLPEVIGIGIAFNIFFNWPYWVGVLLSLLTTMVFLFTANYGIRYLEAIIAMFVGIMGIAIFVELDHIGADSNAVMRGWTIGVFDLGREDMFSILGVIGAVVMPHNLYLHSGACTSRRVREEHAEKAVFWSSIEPILPFSFSYFINLAVVCIAAESVYNADDGKDHSEIGLTDFCTYFKKIAGCALWGIALLASGQSSAITTTYTGQYVMDGFLNLQLSVRARAIITRLVAILPCILTSILFPTQLNQMVNIVNALLSFLLPFAFTPLVKFNCSEVVMGQHASKGWEKTMLFSFAFAVYLINAVGLSLDGGGFFGEWRSRGRDNEQDAPSTGMRWFMLVLEISVQVLYAWWNWNCIRSEIKHEAIPSSNITEEATIQSGDRVMLPVSPGIDEREIL